MSRFTKQNYHNIQCIFEEKTGIDLNPEHRCQPAPRRKLLVAALAAVCCLLMASCTYMLFSPLNGDAFSLRGSYEDGIVSVLVVNGSEKELRFQEQVKLMSWQEGEIPSTGGEVVFENTVFAPHSSGTMTVDLRNAYPMEALEQGSAPNDLYLILTNNGFRFGYDWQCSFLIREAEPEAARETQPAETATAEVMPGSQNISGIDESLRFYFEEHYLDEAPAFNQANGDYMVAVQELLSRQKGTQVHSVDPLLCADDPEAGVIFDPGIPEAVQYQMVSQNHFSLDSFNRMVSSVFPGNGMDTALMLGVLLPQYQDQTDGGIGDFRLLYYFTFPTQEVKQTDAYAFIYGRVLTFPEMEGSMVYQDELYTVYDMTDLFYTDLDAYIDDFLSAYGGRVYFDEQVRRRIHNIYDYYRDPEKLRFHYVIDPQEGLHATPFVEAP